MNGFCFGDPEIQSLGDCCYLIFFCLFVWMGILLGIRFHVIDASFGIGPVIAIESNLDGVFGRKFGIIEWFCGYDFVCQIGQTVGFPCGFVFFLESLKMDDTHTQINPINRIQNDA